MSGDAKNSEINSVAIYSRLTKNMSQIDWTIIGRCESVKYSGHNAFNEYTNKTASILKNNLDI